MHCTHKSEHFCLCEVDSFVFTEEKRTHTGTEEHEAKQTKRLWKYPRTMHALLLMWWTLYTHRQLFLYSYIFHFSFSDEKQTAQHRWRWRFEYESGFAKIRFCSNWCISKESNVTRNSLVAAIRLSIGPSKRGRNVVLRRCRRHVLVLAIAFCFSLSFSALTTSLVNSFGLLSILFSRCLFSLLEFSVFSFSPWFTDN